MQRGLGCQDRVYRRCSGRAICTDGVEICSVFRVTREHAGFVLVADVLQPLEIFIENRFTRQQRFHYVRRRDLVHIEL